MMTLQQFLIAQQRFNGHKVHELTFVMLMIQMRDAFESRMLFKILLCCDYFIF